MDFDNYSQLLEAGSVNSFVGMYFSLDAYSYKDIYVTRGIYPT